MIHDPLCDWWEKQCEITGCDGQRPYSDICKHDYCQCILISKVREDERLKESARRMEKFGYWHDYRPELP